MPANSSGMKSGSASGLGRVGSSATRLRIPITIAAVQPKKNVSRQRPATTRCIGSSATTIPLAIITRVSSVSANRLPASQVRA